jgi:two-component system nitrogen regulation response regulator NtrX
MPSVLIVDDEPNIRRMVSAQLRADGYDVREAATGADGFASATAHLPDVAVVDLMMPGGMDGLALLERLHEALPDLPVVMMSGRASLADAVRATRLGAFTFLEKPLSPESVLLAITSALELRQVRRAAQTLREDAGLTSPLVGESAAMAEVRQRIAAVGPTDARVLITGESGTGKELVAAALHAASARRDRPLVRVNCAAIPRDLVESEMFGHERGAFTGATERRIGRFELAHTGTLLLDEIGDLSLEAQAKLLRAIEAQEIERVGGASPVRVDVRVLAATNQDLARAVRDGTFREDLFFRLNVIPMALPTLRDRLEDIPALVQHLSHRVRQRSTVGCCSFTADALRVLAAHQWPGNVRELANTVERLAILYPGVAVTGNHVRSVLPDAATPALSATDTEHRTVQGTVPPTSQPVQHTSSSTSEPAADATENGLPLADALDAHERTLIERALAASRGNIAEAARRLHTDRRHLYRRMERLGITLALLLCVLSALGGTSRVAHAQTVIPEPRIGAVAPATVARVLDRWNATDTRRMSGPVVIRATDTVHSTLAVRDGTLALRGVVLGDIVALNTDVTLFSGARIGGSLLVVGGALIDSTGAVPGGTTIAGGVEWWRAQLDVRDTTDASGAPQLVADSLSLAATGPRWRVRDLGD